jgi:hypothetical protein
MPPRRRDRQSTDLKEEREEPRGRGRQVQNPEVDRELHNLHAMIVYMDIRQRRKDDVGDISEYENEDDTGHGEEEIPVEYATNEHLLEDLTRMGAKLKMNIPVYEGNLDVEEILDWIRALGTYFDYEDVGEEKKVRHAITRLKGHVALIFAIMVGCHSSVHIKRNKLEKLTSSRHRGEMLRQKMMKVEDR